MSRKVSHLPRKIHEYKVGEVTIEFPYEAYPAQLKYMEHVIQALSSGSNALLESPTGTGKTLCLLTATLAWVQEESRREKLGLKSLRTPEALAKRAQINATLQNESQDFASRVQRMASAQPTRGPFSLNRSNSALDPFSGKGITLGAQTSTSQAIKDATTATILGIPKIIYASRTHSQLSQVVKELKHTKYQPSVRVLASREQLCINPAVKRYPSQMQHYACRSLVEQRQCRFKTGLDRYPSLGTSFLQGAVNDIEDLLEIGQSEKICPYFLSRTMIEEAEVLFLPYNYLFDGPSRQQLNIDVLLRNAIVIFDEAHNLEGFCSDSSSFELTAVHIGKCIKELHEVMVSLEEREKNKEPLPEVAGIPLTSMQVLAVKSRMSRIEATILDWLDNKESRPKCDDLEQDQDKKTGELETDIRLPGPAIYQLLGDINFSNHMQLLQGLAAMVNYILQGATVEAAAEAGTTPGSTAALLNQTRMNANRNLALDRFMECLRLLFDGDNEVSIKKKSNESFRLLIKREKSKPQQNKSRKSVFGSAGNDENGSGDFTLTYRCFSPALAMSRLSKSFVHSILLTSGTLSPMNSFAQELGIDFLVRLQNPHVIDTSQIFAAVVPKGPRGEVLTSAYSARGDVKPIFDLGILISNLSRTVPDGMLVFFPSYSSLERTVSLWRTIGSMDPNAAESQKIITSSLGYKPEPVSNNNQNRRSTTNEYVEEQFGHASILADISKTKRVVIEPRSSSAFPSAMEYFRTSIDKGQGAIFLGVCRGKASEGYDFSDAHARAVIITGIPFPNRADPQVDLKFKLLNKQYQAATSAEARANMMSGGAWYSLEAARAVNQAIGRVIRHRNDFGAIFLCDTRFSTPHNISQLSSWLRPSVKVYDNFAEPFQQSASFFKQMIERFPKSSKYRLQDGLSSMDEFKSGQPLSFSTKGSGLPAMQSISANRGVDHEVGDDLLSLFGSATGATKRNLGKETNMDGLTQRVKLDKDEDSHADEVLMQGRHIINRRVGRNDANKLPAESLFDNQKLRVVQTTTSVKPVESMRNVNSRASPQNAGTEFMMTIDNALALARKSAENLLTSPQSIRRNAATAFWILARAIFSNESSNDSGTELEDLRNLFAQLATEDKLVQIQKQAQPLDETEIALQSSAADNRKATNDWMISKRPRLHRVLTEIAMWICVRYNTKDVLTDPLVTLLIKSLPSSYGRVLEFHIINSIPGSEVPELKNKTESQGTSSMDDVNGKVLAPVEITDKVNDSRKSGPAAAAEAMAAAKSLFSQNKDDWAEFVSLVKRLRDLNKRIKEASSYHSSFTQEARELGIQGFHLLKKGLNENTRNVRLKLASQMLVVVGPSLEQVWKEEAVEPFTQLCMKS